LIVVIQIGIIVFLLTIQQKSNNTLGVSINFIDPKVIQSTQVDGLKYFYEPRANSAEEIHEEWLPYAPKYTINSDALNERFEYEVKKNDGVFRIITLGDSFTFGQNVSTERNWTELLEKYLNMHFVCNTVKKYEVINLGVYAYDMEYEVERYKLRGQKYNPDLVIWTFTDYERIIEKMMPLIKKNDTDENKALEKGGVFYHNWQVAREDMLNKIGQRGLIEYQKNQVKQLDEYFKGRLLFVTLPNRSEYISILKERTKERVNTVLFEPKISWKQEGLFLPDHHFNDAGNMKMMEEIAGFLIKNKLIPCTQQKNQ